jgi:hypothetical protein
MATETKYKVNWDNGNGACGTFSNVFDTEEAAQAFAEDWVVEMTNTIDADDETAEGYSAEVIEVVFHPELVDQREYGFGPEFWS